MYLLHEFFPESKDPSRLSEYFNFINTAKTCTKISRPEHHHILPKSMGGSDHLDNIITLSAADHYHAHYLLWLAYHNMPMSVAFWRMSHDKNHQPITGVEYQILREEQAKHASIVSTKSTTEWHKNKSPETEANRRAAIRKTLQDRYQNLSLEEKSKHAVDRTGKGGCKLPKPKIVCRLLDHKEMPIAHYTRWANNNPT